MSQTRHPWSVYTFRDTDGNCLYVGATSSLLRRLSNHSSTKAWFPRIATVEVEHVSDKEEAFALERVLQTLHQPEYCRTARQPEALRNSRECTYFRHCGARATSFITVASAGDPMTRLLCADHFARARSTSRVLARGPLAFSDKAAA